MNEPSSAPVGAGLAAVASGGMVLPAGQGRLMDLGDHRSRILVSSEQSSGAFLLMEAEVDPQGGPPPHIHRREDETFVILEGRFVVFMGEDVVEAGPGDTVFAARGVPHGWRCVDESGGRLLILATPGENFESFACEMAERALLSLPLLEAIAALNELGARHGIEMLPPPAEA